MKGIRTEIQTTDWWPCERCKKPTYVCELIGRREVVGETRWYNLLYIRVLTQVHYRNVSICPTCDTQEKEMEKTQQKRKAIAVVGLSIGYVTWYYLGPIWLVIAAAFTVAGAYLNKRKQRALVQMEER